MATFVATRVCQLDALRFEPAIFQAVSGELLAAFSKYRVHSHYEEVAKFLVRFLIFYRTIWVGRPTPAMQLQNVGVAVGRRGKSLFSSAIPGARADGGGGR